MVSVPVVKVILMKRLEITLETFISIPNGGSLS